MEEQARNYLSQLANDLRGSGNAEGAGYVDEALKEYNRRYWHEMSVALLKAVGVPAVLERAYDLHDSVLRVVRADISPVAYVKLIHAVCFSPVSTMERALQVIEGAQACFLGQDATQARYAAQCIRAMLLLVQDSGSNVRAVSGAGGVWCHDSNRESASMALVPGTAPHTARKILEEVEKYVRTLQMHEAEPVLLAMLARARGRDYVLREQYTKYYHNAFDIVTFTDKAEMVTTEADMGELALNTAIAALMSDELYNFGRFLNFPPFVEALGGQCATAAASASASASAGGGGSKAGGRPNHDWVLQWMRVCNDGDVARFETFYTSHRAVIEDEARVLATATATDHLGKKVRLMALLHLVFYTPFNQRNFSFDVIAQRCAVPAVQAEPLLLAALAQGIVRGKIDGLERTVHISWVEPRVLSLTEVKELSAHVAAWREGVVGVTNYVSQQAEQIIR